MTPRERIRLLEKIRQAVEPLGCAFIALGDHQVTITFPDLATAAKIILEGPLPLFGGEPTDRLPTKEDHR